MKALVLLVLLAGGCATEGPARPPSRCDARCKPIMDLCLAHCLGGGDMLGAARAHMYVADCRQSCWTNDDSCYAGCKGR